MGKDDKCYPKYDEHTHIDSGALDHKPKPKEDYTAQYLAPLSGQIAPPQTK